MIESLVQQLGPWVWWVLGLVLLIMEIMVPGVFLIWIGIAAIITGALSLAFWSQGFWIWEVQLLIFAALALGSVLVGRNIMNRTNETDEPNLNRRTEGLVGRTATLSEDIANGRGRIKLDDTTWVVSGPDLPSGSRVRIVSTNGADLTVEPA